MLPGVIAGADALGLGGLADPAQLAEAVAFASDEAESAGDLREAYDKMGSLVSKVERKQEVTFAFLAGGLVLLLAAAAVAVVTFPRLP